MPWLHDGRLSCSKTIRSAILRSGSLSFILFFKETIDHTFLDLSTKHLFCNHTHEMHHPSYRTLTLNDPRKIVKYKESLYFQLQKHKVYEKCKKLRIIPEGGWTDTHTREYLILDQLIMKAMLQSENKVGKVKIGKVWVVSHIEESGESLQILALEA